MPTKNPAKYIAKKRSTDDLARIDQLSWAVWSDIKDSGLDSERACKVIKESILAALDSPRMNRGVPELDRTRKLPLGKDPKSGKFQGSAKQIKRGTGANSDAVQPQTLAHYKNGG